LAVDKIFIGRASACDSDAPLFSSGASIGAVVAVLAFLRSDWFSPRDGIWGSLYMASAELESERVINPIDLVEQLAQSHDWPLERASDDELTLIVAGTWADYHVSLNWRDDLEALHLACAFDFRVPENRLPEMYRLVAQINEQLWLGHFDLWTQEGLVMFRHALLLNGAVPTVRQCEAMLKAALEGCERYYQAFQFVVWAGKESREALVSTMFETQGQA
jgi:hypothetical protein